MHDIEFITSPVSVCVCVTSYQRNYGNNKNQNGELYVETQKILF